MLCPEAAVGLSECVSAQFLYIRFTSNPGNEQLLKNKMV